MAITKIFKKGAILMLEIASVTNRVMMHYPHIETVGTNIVITELIRRGGDAYGYGGHESIPIDPITTPIADVRDEANTAIGGQSQVNVEDYIAEEMAK